MRTAVEHSTPSEQVRAAAAEDSLFADRPAWQWALVGALLLALAAVVATALRRRRRRADPARDAHAADPARFAHAGEDPALRLRALTELLALAADAPGARALPQARDATAAVVEHTLALDALAPGSRQGRPDAFRRSVRPELEDRVGRAGATLRVLVAAGRDARPAVRFPDAVLEAAR
ncbi:hypothetical protein ACEUE7_11755 [Micrococcus endophyticus]|uniref:hypothetical protein n=1 Tax=Micrococcus endophyticus TaxID=455343 RepID=UPI0035A97F8D